MKDILEETIKQAGGLADALRDCDLSSPRIGNAISAARAVEDNCRYELEHLAAAEKAAHPAKTAKPAGK